MKLSFLIFTVSILSFSCSNSSDSSSEDGTSDQIDKNLFTEITSKSFTYYKGNAEITAARGNSPHGFIRTKFDSIAFSVLDANQNLPSGKTFPNGSLIVKEVYTDANGSLKFYAVMKKNPASTVAGSGYEWAEFRANGETYFSTGKKGNGCISCHSNSTNRDLVRTFDLH